MHVSHIHRNNNQLEMFEVVLQQYTLPTPETIFIVEVINKANRSYFHGICWIDDRALRAKRARD
jgi:hypothetical protein